MDGLLLTVVAALFLKDKHMRKVRIIKPGCGQLGLRATGTVLIMRKDRQAAKLVEQGWIEYVNPPKPKAKPPSDATKPAD